MKDIFMDKLWLLWEFLSAKTIHFFSFHPFNRVFLFKKAKKKQDGSRMEAGL